MKYINRPSGLTQGISSRSRWWHLAPTEEHSSYAMPSVLKKCSETYLIYSHDLLVAWLINKWIWIGKCIYIYIYITAIGFYPNGSSLAFLKTIKLYLLEISSSRAFQLRWHLNLNSSGPTVTGRPAPSWLSLFEFSITNPVSRSYCQLEITLELNSPLPSMNQLLESWSSWAL
jgi:hypothetical protein